MTDTLLNFYGWIVILCQLFALFAIFVGVVKGFFIYCKNIFTISNAEMAFQSSRLAMGYSFSLGLSFLIGASILTTAIAPTWNDIAQLAVIILLRTIINFLLLRAIERVNFQQESDKQN